MLFRSLACPSSKPAAQHTRTAHAHTPDQANRTAHISTSYTQQACSNNATPKYRHGPQCPALRANPFSKVADPICRLPLPTLLKNQRLLTLGTCCGCWHEKHKQETIHLSLFENHGHTTHLSRQGFVFIHTPFPQAS